jgi:WD40 repeat protein
LRIVDEQGHTERTLPFPHPERGAWALAATPHGLFCLDQGPDGTARVRDETNKVRLSVPVPAGAQIQYLAVSPNLREFAIAWNIHSEISTRVYDSSAKERTRLPYIPTGFLSLVFSPDGTRLATASDDHTARLWDAATGQPIAGPLRHPDKIGLVTAAFRPDGARIVTASRDGTVCQWDARTGASAEPPYERHAGAVWTAVYSPDGQWIASAGDDRTIQLWRATGRSDALILHGHTAKVTQLAFTRDGRRLGSVSEDGTARIWETDSQASLPVLRGHGADIYPVAYSPDGQWIASGSWGRR